MEIKIFTRAKSTGLISPSAKNDHKWPSNYESPRHKYVGKSATAQRPNTIRFNRGAINDIFIG